MTGAAAGGAPPAGAGAGAGPGRDPGLQPERTRLAWRRTTLACAVTAVLAVRQAVRGPGTAPEVAGCAFIVLLWLAFLGVAHRRIRALAAPRPPVLGERAALGATACVLALAVFAVAVLL
ncbi:DUF202 domain-containing protein [Streptomyces antimicrobicus]|uniref:DUF202 domain-containing protein n=1 Tax=Streptomyces antimicrobicus TaxID=2883108 RepID=A0ABS8BE42_9ACTN|nr:DUF202 domain-containing protein [Streptomyces antimicrobicus]MCB5182776.1 DUF202 domain-containing protein [Streptomyces antimicrobicus]